MWSIYMGCMVLIIIVLIVQSVMLYKVYVSNLKKEQPKLDMKSKEWIDFVDLFNGKIQQNGYVVIYSGKTEEIMLHFHGVGTSHDYHKDKYILKRLYFECSGTYDFDGEDVPCRMASYDLNVDNIVSATPIEEYFGEYRDTDNEHYVTLTLKNENKVEIIFNYKESSL